MPGAREAYPLLRASGAGSIVTVASIQGQYGGRNTFPYSAAKGGLLGLTLSLAIEYAPEVRVNAVIPAQIEAEWITGTFLMVDGGWSAALPDLSDLR